VEDGGISHLKSSHLSEKSSHFICHSCKFKSCLKCCRQFHPGRDCLQNLESLRHQRFAVDEPSKSWLNSHAKPCSCGRWIQKLDGCDHVKCPPRPVGCGEEWCWRCGAKYEFIRKEGNRAHKADCPHFS